MQALGDRREDPRPYPAYRALYPELSDETVFDLAYFFETDEDRKIASDRHIDRLSAVVDSWRACQGQGGLFRIGARSRIAILDSRPMVPVSGRRILDPVESEIYYLCDTERPAYFLHKQMPEVSEGRLLDILKQFCAAGLMWSDGQKFLSLAVSLDEFLDSRRPSDRDLADQSFVERAGIADAALK